MKRFKYFLIKPLGKGLHYFLLTMHFGPHHRSGDYHFERLTAEEIGQEMGGN